jgi:SAM-dependent methyltransferase
MMVQHVATKPWHWVRGTHQQGRRLLWRAIDGALGVHTTPLESAQKPWGWLSGYRLLRWVHPQPDDVFLDIGSGHGRVVLLASLFQFKRVIGVELSAPVHLLAQQNLSTFRMRRQAEVKFIQADAAAYVIPTDVTVIFLYNPFPSETFRRCIQHVFDSLDQAPRRLRLIYANPVEHDYLISTGRCQFLHRFRGWRPTQDWARELAVHFYDVESRDSR